MLNKKCAVLIFLITIFAMPAYAGRTVPYPPYFDTKTAGASSYEGAGNVKNSPYFPKLDFYNMKSGNSGLTIITGFPTYQQSTETTCGPAAALTVLDYFGNKKYDEQMLSILMGTKHEAQKDGEMGTSTSGIVKFFKTIGWKVHSSLDRKKGMNVDFDSPAVFKDFVLKNLKAGTPILVENMYWGGHWRVIIGYDTLGTDKTTDDVLIFMDPYDVLDHEQDGYTIENAEGFYYTWKDMEYLPRGESVQMWITARP